MLDLVEMFEKKIKGIDECYDKSSLHTLLRTINNAFLRVLEEAQFELKRYKSYSFNEVLDFIARCGSKWDIDIQDGKLLVEVNLKPDKFMKDSKIYKFPYESPFYVDIIEIRGWGWDNLFGVGIHPNISIDSFSICTGDFGSLEFNFENFENFVESLKTINFDSAYDFTEFNINIDTLEPVEDKWTASGWD